MNRRGLLALLGALGAIGLAGFAIAAQDSGGEPERATTTPAPTTTTVPQGDAPERDSGPIVVPDAAKLAGPPLRIARRFMSVWLNRTPSAAVVRRQRRILVELAVGSFAQLMQVTADDAIATGEFGPTNEGRVEFAKFEDSGPGMASVLLVCRERPEGASPTYTTYLAKLLAVAPGRYAMGDLEPQS